MGFGPVFLSIIGLVAWICLALWPARIASRKGHSFILFLLLGIVTSFLFSLLVAALVKDRNATAKSRADDAAVEKAMHKAEGIE